MFPMVVFGLVSFTDPYSREYQAQFAKWYANDTKIIIYPCLISMLQ